MSPLEAMPYVSLTIYDLYNTYSTPKTEPPRTKARIRVAAVINDQNSNLGEWIVRPSILEVDGIQTFLNSNEPQYPIEGDLWFEQST